MDKTAIKNFAVRARNKLIDDITQKAFELGISEDEIKDIIAFEGGFTIKGLNNSKTYKKYQEKQRRKLVDNIKQKGFDQVIEEVAYTWFNRFIALRFMEVNDYLPTGVRVLSSKEEGKVEPDIIKEALNVDLEIDRELVYKLIDENDTEDLYRYLLVKQCNELGKIMPQVFEEISDYTELLLPDNLLGEGSVIRDLVDSVEEEDYKDQVEIIGWMYQYYISEKKDEVFADLKKNKKITKENIPAATQLFTPKWIVKYMIENSLGRLWLESHPDEDLQSKWRYYLEEAEQEPEVREQLDELKDPKLNPEDIKVLDPSMGSGHILVYAFDVLYDIYLKANYSERDIPRLILEKNLYGLDIDDRAGQLAAFALMMKARSNNRRIFRRKIELNVCSIQESNGISKEAMDYFVNTEDVETNNKDLKEDVEYLIHVFHDAKEYGSLLDVKKIDFDAIERKIAQIQVWDTEDLFEYQYKETILEKILPLVKQGRIMSRKYDVVCTNPPYMGGRKGMNHQLKKYVQKNYKSSNSDLYACFIEKCLNLSKNNKFVSMVTQHSFMFTDDYKELREKLLNSIIFVNMLHLGTDAFPEINGEVVQTTTFTIRNVEDSRYKGEFVRLLDYECYEKEKHVHNKNLHFNIYSNTDFKDIKGTPFAYWISERVKQTFKIGTPFEEIGKPRQGLATGNNDIFLRAWYEVENIKIGFGFKTIDSFHDSGLLYAPYNKGGKQRRWYGNNENIIKFDKEHFQTLSTQGNRLPSRQYYFQKCITWSDISGRNFAGRYCDYGFVFDVKGSSGFPRENYFLYVLAFLNSKLTPMYIDALNPTITTQVGDLKRIPLLKINAKSKDKIDKLAKQNIKITKDDWDSFETSWDFKHHPLLDYSILKSSPNLNKIETAINNWSDFTEEQFEQLKANEEALNNIFIDIYGLQGELTPEVEDKNITISKADRERDIKSLISYAVGCMFGRYSLDEEGLIYAGGEFDINSYNTFIPTTDNILVIADDDYFEDDIVSRFVDFVKITFGEETLEENLDYVAESLGQRASETARQTIRRYFQKDFYKDHVKTYQKRPIYWLFDSGRQNGFKALIYMHRYEPYTVSRVRTDYLHKLQRMYEAEVDRIDMYLENNDITPREKSARIKKKEGLLKQIQECLVYDQIIAHVANQKIDINLDDGVKVNYTKFQGVEVPQGEGKKPLKANLLSKI